MDTIPCKALRAFTEHVFGYGMVHGDPDNSDERARFPLIPATVLDRLVDEEKIVPCVDPLDHDHDGEKGGSESGETSTAHKGAVRKAPAKAAKTKAPAKAVTDGPPVD